MVVGILREQSWTHLVVVPHSPALRNWLAAKKAVEPVVGWVVAIKVPFQFIARGWKENNKQAALRRMEQTKTEMPGYDGHNGGPSPVIRCAKHLIPGGFPHLTNPESLNRCDLANNLTTSDGMLSQLEIRQQDNW